MSMGTWEREIDPRDWLVTEGTHAIDPLMSDGKEEGKEEKIRLSGGEEMQAPAHEEND